MLAWAATIFCMGAQAKPPKPPPKAGAEAYEARNGDFLIDLPAGWYEGDASTNGSAVFHFVKRGPRYDFGMDMYAPGGGGYTRPDEALAQAKAERDRAEQAWTPVATTSKVFTERLPNNAVAHYYYNTQAGNPTHLLGGILWWAGHRYRLSGLMTDPARMKPLLAILATIRIGPHAKPLKEERAVPAKAVELPQQQSAPAGAIQIDDHKTAPLLR